MLGEYSVSKLAFLGTIPALNNFSNMSNKVLWKVMHFCISKGRNIGGRKGKKEEKEGKRRGTKEGEDEGWGKGERKDLLFLSFQGCTRGIWRLPGQESNWSCSCRTTPQPQQHWIQASSAINTTAHGNAGSLTH